MWCMQTKGSVCLHCLHIGILPVNTCTIDLKMNTLYFVIPSLEVKYKSLFP